jgi:hypothetical protein
MRKIYINETKLGKLLREEKFGIAKKGRIFGALSGLFVGCTFKELVDDGNGISFLPRKKLSLWIRKATKSRRESNYPTVSIPPLRVSRLVQSSFWTQIVKR